MLLSRFSITNDVPRKQATGCAICNTPSCIFTQSGCIITVRDIFKSVMLCSAFAISYSGIGPLSLLFLTPYAILGFTGAVIRTFSTLKRVRKRNEGRIPLCDLWLNAVTFPFHFVYFSIGTALNVAHSAHKFIDPPRFSNISRNPFISALLKYAMPINRPSIEIISKRMLVINYYFSSFFKSFRREDIHRINMINVRVTALHRSECIEWSLNEFGMASSERKALKFLSATVMVYLWNMVLVNGLLLWNGYFVENGSVPIYVVAMTSVWTLWEMINVFIDLKSIQEHWKSAHLLPYLSKKEQQIAFRLQLATKFEYVMDMMHILQALDDIMFEANVLAIKKYSPLNMDLAMLVHQYLWWKLPDYDAHFGTTLNHIILQSNPRVKIRWRYHVNNRRRSSIATLMNDTLLVD